MSRRSGLAAHVDAAVALLLLGCAPLAALGAAGGSAPVRALVLGLVQDGGLPHIGCEQPVCLAARRDPRLRRRVACLGLIDDVSGQRFLIDATPDLPLQLASLNAAEPARRVERRRPVDGILLTHAHIGHYTGLMYLGREALDARRVPVYATPRMARFLRGNAPWSQLVALEEIEIHELEPGVDLRLTPRLSVVARRVPHRAELSDTVGYEVRGPSRRLLYVPDIDKWERWDERLEDAVGRVDVALLDGTFLDAAEIPGRSIGEIPHPLVGETLARLQAHPELLRRVLFVHLNHTNALLWDSARAAALAPARVARDGEEIGL
jgi:pyrroloquinoline quinone biosynthesis protein B